MAEKRKVFLSYKYADGDVANFSLTEKSTARTYVDKLEKLMGDDFIIKWEADDEDLSALSEDTIAQKLFDRIYDSSLTIVLISKGMRDTSKSEKNQWIPREVSYSLSENSRNGVTSHTNAMLAVILPDSSGSYEHFVSPCQDCGSFCRIWHTENTFNVIAKNMFNIKHPDQFTCSKDSDSLIFRSPCSYIVPVRWDHYVNNISGYVAEAYSAKDNIDDYTIVKQLS